MLGKKGTSHCICQGRWRCGLCRARSKKLHVVGSVEEVRDGRRQNELRVTEEVLQTMLAKRCNIGAEKNDAIPFGAEQAARRSIIHDEHDDGYKNIVAERHQARSKIDSEQNERCSTYWCRAT